MSILVRSSFIFLLLYIVPSVAYTQQCITQWSLLPRLEMLPGSYDPLPYALFDQWDQSKIHFDQHSEAAVDIDHCWVSAPYLLSWSTLPTLLANQHAQYIYALHENKTSKHSSTPALTSPKKITLYLQSTHPVDIWIDGILTYQIKKDSQWSRPIQLNIPSDYQQLLLRFTPALGFPCWTLTNKATPMSTLSKTVVNTHILGRQKSMKQHQKTHPMILQSKLQQMIEYTEQTALPKSPSLLWEHWHLTDAIPTHKVITVQSIQWMPHASIKKSLIKNHTQPNLQFCHQQWIITDQHIRTLQNGILYAIEHQCYSGQNTWLDQWEVPTQKLVWKHALWSLSIDLHQIDQDASFPDHQSWQSEAGGRWYWDHLHIQKTDKKMTWSWRPSFPTSAPLQSSNFRTKAVLYWSAFPSWTALAHQYTRLFDIWSYQFLNEAKHSHQKVKSESSLSLILPSNRSLRFPHRRLWTSKNTLKRSLPYIETLAHPLFSLDVSLQSNTLAKIPLSPIQLAIQLQAEQKQKYHQSQSYPPNKNFHKKRKFPSFIIWDMAYREGVHKITSLDITAPTPQALAWFGYLDQNQQPRMLNGEILPEYSVWLGIYQDPSLTATTEIQSTQFPQTSLNIKIFWDQLSDFEKQVSWEFDKDQESITPTQLWAWSDDVWKYPPAVDHSLQALSTQLCHSSKKHQLFSKCQSLAVDTHWWKAQWTTTDHHLWIKQDLLSILHTHTKSTTTRLVIFPQQKGARFTSDQTHMSIRPLRLLEAPSQIPSHWFITSHKVLLPTHVTLTRRIFIPSQFKDQLNLVSPVQLDHQWLSYRLSKKQYDPQTYVIEITFQLYKQTLLNTEYPQWNQLVKSINKIEHSLQLLTTMTH